VSSAKGSIPTPVCISMLPLFEISFCAEWNILENKLAGMISYSLGTSPVRRVKDRWAVFEIFIVNVCMVSAEGN
jgi:hypothetical protein